MAVEQIRKIGDQPLREILVSKLLTWERKSKDKHFFFLLQKFLGGWPVIEPNWKPPNISIEKLMGTLRGEYSEPVLIELYVGADDKNSSINILQVSFPEKDCKDDFSIYCRQKIIPSWISSSWRCLQEIIILKLAVKVTLKHIIVT